MKVDPQEIVFFYENQPKGFPQRIVERLESQGIKANRTRVHLEVFLHKKNYNPHIIEAARVIMKAIKNIEYTQAA